MKTIKYLLIAVLCLAAVPTFARDFSISKNAGYFACDIQNPRATVTIQTHNVDARGFACRNSGDQRKGSITLSGGEVNTYFFIIKPDSNPFKASSMTVTTNGKIIRCDDKRLGHPVAFRQGDKFCASAPEKK